MTETIRPLTADEIAYYRRGGTFDGVNLAAYEPCIMGETAPRIGGQLVYRPRTAPDATVPLVVEE